MVESKQVTSRGEPSDDFSASSQCADRGPQIALSLAAAFILLETALAAADLGARFTSLRRAAISFWYSSCAP
jgi:hypothetical protein